jgi:D-glycero-D-manno-heptose 1,7-bisphosphate phosphatase
MEPAIFLDRDGTLIADDANAGHPASVVLLDGVPASLRRLRDAGFRLVVATNQGGVARGRFTEVDVDAVHRKIGDLIDAATGLKRTIERFYYCPFHPQGSISEYTRDHPWRKPSAGMMKQATQDMELDVDRSWLVGDSPRDIAAGRSAGLRTILVTRDRTRLAEAAPDYSAATLAEATEIILRHRDDRGMDHGLDRKSDRDSDRKSDRKSDREETPASVAKPKRTTSRSTSATLTRSAGSLTRKKGGNPRLRRALAELTDEVRALRLRRAETGAVRIAAMGMQLLAILVGAIAFLNLSEFEQFARWGICAALIQLVTATMLLFDRS